MSKLSTFLVKDYTKDGYAMAIAGICSFIFSDKACNEVRSLIKDYTFPLTNDVFEIDYCMACHFSKVAPDYILGWGITIDVPSAPGPTGGVIGNPQMAIESADSQYEDIGNGLSLAAHPGGPGIIIQGNRQWRRRFLNV